MVKDYECDILYHLGKENVVVDALSRKSATSSIGGLYMRISIDSRLLDLIRKAKDERCKKENWKQERIRGEIDRFSIDIHGLLTWCSRV